MVMMVVVVHQNVYDTLKYGQFLPEMPIIMFMMMMMMMMMVMMITYDHQSLFLLERCSIMFR